MERGKHGYPIKYMVCAGDYRSMTPIVIYFDASREVAQGTYDRIKPVDFPQLFAIEVDRHGDFLDSKRLSPDWATKAA